MHQLGSPTMTRALFILGAIIVVGGLVLALLNGFVFGTFGSFTSSPQAVYNGAGVSGFAHDVVLNPSYWSSGSYTPQNIPQTQSIGISTTTMMSTTQNNYPGNQVRFNTSTGPAQGTGSMLQFSSDLTIQSASPQAAASQVIALAYSAGGYVAYQSTSKTSAYIVIRVPASQYQKAVSGVEALGTLVTITSNSNDVRVQYTDLNATLASLRTEQEALLRLLNKSASINTTLSIEGQLQGVNQQINDIQSQILQTKTLIEFSTINVTISQDIPLSMSLKAAPLNGTVPASVTFNAVIKGGTQPYVVNYNFGDGTGDQGQILIHTYYQPGDFKVTVTVTDQNGTVVTAGTKVHVDQAPGQSAVTNFLGTVGNLFVSVVEGIIEVAVVVLPLAAVGAVVILPFRRRASRQKTVTQSQ